MIAPGLRIGRYEVGARLGTGGFGVVYLARDTELGRDLAIKVLRSEYQTQPDVVGRFLKEARAAAKIDHPGIVTVFECGHIAGTGTGADGNAFIAMELLRGQSLASVLAARGRLPLGEAVQIARQIAAALAVAHAAGIVHRDLKPDNVFLIPDTLVRGGVRIKILDFGVAKLAEPKEDGVHTHAQMMLGTPKYMSPEQARSAADVDPRTDVYTLGCMLYEMVTGQAPYEGPGAIDLIIQHTTSPVPSPAALLPELPHTLDALVQQMLAKEADARPASMHAVELALDTIETAAAAARRLPSTPVPRGSSSAPALPRTPSRPQAAMPPPRNTPLPGSLPAAGRVSDQLAAAARPSAHALPAARPSRPPSSALPLFEAGEDTVARSPGTLHATTSKRILVGALITAAVLSVAVWAVSRDPRRTSGAPPDGGVLAGAVEPRGSAGPAAAPDAGGLDPAAARRECQQLAERQRWEELQACGDRLRDVDPSLGKLLHDKGVDEAANQLQLRRLDEELRKQNFDAANTLVKRIPDDSVYKTEARRRLEAAVATEHPAEAAAPSRAPHPLLRAPRP